MMSRLTCKDLENLWFVTLRSVDDSPKAELACHEFLNRLQRIMEEAKFGVEVFDALPTESGYRFVHILFVNTEQQPIPALALPALVNFCVFKGGSFCVSEGWNFERKTGNEGGVIIRATQLQTGLEITCADHNVQTAEAICRSYFNGFANTLKLPPYSAST